MTNTTGMKKVSAIIACYRDAQAIPIMYQRLKEVFQKLGADYEIIYVNDCSPDNTREILADLTAHDKKVIAINHTRNFGSQSAFTSGMRIASGDAAVLMDGDLQDPPEVIESLFNKWQEGNDVVYGERIKREAPFLLRICYKIFYRLFCAMSYIPMPADAGDFSLLDRRVIDAINSLPETNRFVRGLRAWVGFKQTGVPYARPERMFGRTTNSLLKNLGWARKAIFSFSYLPLSFINGLAFMMVLISFLAAAIQLISRIFFPSLAPRGVATVIILVTLIGGIQLLCLSIIGSYVAHIYDETKRRPPYIVESYFNYPPG